MSVIYLDNAATTQLLPEALDAMLPALREQFGNPGSLHRLGAAAARAIEEAREALARALACEPGEVVFTSGGTEANALAITGAIGLARGGRPHVVTSAVEHPCVSEQLAQMEERGLCRVTRVPVRSLDPEGIAAAVEPGTALVAVMHVQNETGAVFPVEAIARAVKAKAPRALVHVDGVQAFGKLAPPDVDLYAISAHKVHGPKGAGALRVRKGARLAPLVPGGGQERGLRGGTESVANIVGFGVAARLAASERRASGERLAKLGARLREGLVALGAQLNSPEGGLPSLLNASFPGVPAEPLLHALESRGVMVSTGSACSTRKKKRSPTLQAMGLAPERIDSALRFSLSRMNTDADVEAAISAMADALKQLEATC